MILHLPLWEAIGYYEEEDEGGNQELNNDIRADKTYFFIKKWSQTDPMFISHKGKVFLCVM